MANSLTGRKEFDESLLRIEQNLLKLGSLAEEAISGAIWALQKQDDALALKVIEGDDVLDDLTQQEKGGLITDAGRLLHVMGHDDNRIVVLQVIHQVLDLECR